MRIPRKPPNWRTIIGQAIKGDNDHFHNVLAASQQEAERPDRYLHWDQFRHRVGRGPISPEERWAALKFRRNSQGQPIPLLDANGVPFTFFVSPHMFELLHDIDLRCGGAVSVPAEVTTPQTRDRYYVSSLIEEALTSSQLEGAVVTRFEAKEMLRNGRKPTNAHERMVVNNYQTMQKLGKLKDQDLTPELIKEIHRWITRNTLESADDEARLRANDDNVRVEDTESGEVMHTPPPAEQLEQRLQSLCIFANDRKMIGYLHPVIRSMLLHFWLAYDHPFVDGNGRTARALFYWSMLRHGFWLFEFISISHVILQAPKQYYRAFLYTETDDNDLNYFLFHQLNTASKAIDYLHEYIERKRHEMEELGALLGGDSGWNHRQLALLKHALKHPRATYTVESHRTSHGVVPQTARTDLEGLATKGLLLKSKRGNAFLYNTAENLAEILRGAG